MAWAETLAPSERHCTVKGREVCRGSAWHPQIPGTWSWALGMAVGRVCLLAGHAFPMAPDNRVHGHISELSCGGTSPSSTSWRKATGQHPPGASRDCPHGISECSVLTYSLGFSCSSPR